MHQTIESAVKCRGDEPCGLVAIIKGRAQELTNEELQYAEAYALELADERLTTLQRKVLACLQDN
jgi:hypothetical protein